MTLYAACPSYEEQEPWGVCASSSGRLAGPKPCAQVCTHIHQPSNAKDTARRCSISYPSVDSAEVLLQAVVPQGLVALQRCSHVH